LIDWSAPVIVTVQTPFKTLSQPVQVLRMLRAPLTKSVTFPRPVRVILVPIGKDAEQIAGPFPQLMPAGLLETVPMATPSSVTVSFPAGSVFTKVAATVLAALGTATTHEAPLALSQPLQPPICEPPAGDAVSVTLVPTAKANAQAVPDEPHEIPAGLLATPPTPVPATDTLSVLVGGILVNVSPIEAFALRGVIAQVAPDELSHPLQLPT
jgi:hypothetical protein